jgi:uncharacterized HAD superfamily protein
MQKLKSEKINKLDGEQVKRITPEEFWTWLEQTEVELLVAFNTDDIEDMYDEVVLIE